MRRRIRRATSHRASIIGMVVMLLLLTVCIVYIALSTGKPAPPPAEKKEAEDLVIETPEPCRTGTLTIKNQNEMLYQYEGEIDIVNDGRNGEDINISIDYSDGNVPEITEGE